MTGLYSQYKTDPVKESQGVEIVFDDAENKDGSVPTFLISRMGKSNKKYTKAMEQATRPYRRGNGEIVGLKNEVAEDIFINVFVDTILLGWKNVFKADGSLLEFNRGNAVKLLTELPEVYDRLQEEAKLLANFRDNSLEAEAKN